MKLKKFNSIDELEKEIDSYLEFAERDYTKVDYPAHLLKEKELIAAGALPSSNRRSSAKEKFSSHKNYKDLVNVLNFPKGPKATKNEVDTWYKDPLYGLVNPKNNLIYHNYWIFVNISENSNNPICVFDFVADAFDQMKEIFNSKRPLQNSKYLKNIQAKRGNASTISIENKYNSYIDQQYKNFFSFATRTDSKTSKTQGYFTKESKTLSKIKNFDDFRGEFLHFLKKRGKTITFNGFFDTNNTNIYDSYLAFDIFDDGDNPNDEDRMAFLKDPNYFIYEYAARQAGFFVDQNKPWRLVANLASKPMAAAMRRRLQATKILLKTKESILKYYNFDEDQRENYFNRVGNEDSVVVVSEALVKDVDRVLEFVDYFRNELFGNNTRQKELLKKFKTLVVTYRDDERLKKENLTGTTVAQNYGALMEKDTDPETTNNFKRLYVFSQLFVQLMLAIQEKKSLINFIYVSLENEIKVLHPIEKNFDVLTEDDLYEAVYAPIYEYTYFTYFPKKIEKFYQSFIESHPSYTTFEKTAKGLTKATKNPRQALRPEQTKISNGLINDFYNLDFLIDYIDIRLMEENKRITLEEKKFIINEAKEAYQESFKRYQNGEKIYKQIRNMATKIIEAYIGSPYSKDRPIDLKTKKKKAPIYAQQTIFEESALEPRILLERICLTMPDRADILVEEDVCGKFDLSPTIGAPAADLPTPSAATAGPQPAPSAPAPVKPATDKAPSGAPQANPCCKHLSAPSNPLLSSDGDWLIPAFNLTFGNDYPADIKGNFTDFNKTDVEVLLSLYDSTEGFLNELDTGDIGASFGTIVGKKYYMSAEMRCYLCRRQPQFMLTGVEKQSLLDFFEENLEDEAAAKFLKNEINCEQFGLATYRQKPYNVLSCSTDGQGNCKGFENKAYYEAAKGGCLK